MRKLEQTRLRSANPPPALPRDPLHPKHPNPEALNLIMPYKKKAIPGTGQFNKLISELPEKREKIKAPV